MSKRVLSAFLVIPTLFLGLNFFIPSISFIKTAEAVTISEPFVNGDNNFAGEDGFYNVSFNLTSPLLQNESIGIDFDDSFGFPGGEVEVAPNTTQISCVPQDAIRKINCSPTGNSVFSGSISIDILGVINPAEGTYNIVISTLTQSFTRSVTVGSAESGGDGEEGGTCSFSGGIVKRIGQLIKCVAGLPGLIAKFIAQLIVGIIKGIIGAVVGVFILLAAELVKITASLSFEGATAAKIGYDVSLNLTNIGFIIFIIVIAFATILRKESYAIKKSLPRLIIIALLINFSWFLANFAIDVSNKVAQGLMTAVGTVSGYPFSINQIGNLGSFFKGALSGGNMDSVLPSSFASAFPGVEFLASLLRGLIEIIMQAIFGLIGFFALITTAVMLVIRYVVLSFLLALLPMALLLDIFPNLKVGGQGGAWEKWMSEFTRWLLFYPIAMFFLAVGFAASQGLTEGKISFTQSLNPLLAIVNILVVSGILIGGLIVASKMGITGAAFANNVASKTIRRMPANIAAIGRWGRRGGGVESPAGGARPEPRLGLQLAPALSLGSAAEQAGARQAGDLLNRFSAERAYSPATFAELPEAQRPVPQETPVPQEQRPIPAAAAPSTQQFAERPTAAPRGKLSKLGGKFMDWSRGGPSTMEILNGGIKEFIGDRSKIFSGLYSGGGDEAKKAQEALGKLKEKYENIDKDLFDAVEKLRKDASETDPKKKLDDSIRRHYESKVKRLEESRTKRVEGVESALKKAAKDVRRFSGKSEDVDKFIKENRNIYKPTINT